MPIQNVCLIIIDGWGLSDEEKGNAVKNAKTPVMTALSESPGQYVTLEASGSWVGLPEGLMGNSEVGHINIGAGRVITQDTVQINIDAESKSIFQNEGFVKACKLAKSKSGRLHLLGCISDGSVHSHINHLFALLEGAKENEVPNTYIQFFADGRDSLPTSGVTYVQQVLDKIQELQYGSLATIVGRYYAMDRDKRYERIKVAYEGMVLGVGEKVTPEELIADIEQKYKRKGHEKQTDEFLQPIIVDETGQIQDNDVLLFINFRSDRARQITETFGIKVNFETSKRLKGLKIFTMTQYKKEFPFQMLYPPRIPRQNLAEWISSKGLYQFHCAETEKYGHVTYYFNGGQEAQFPHEDRALVDSPHVDTYDLQPEMSCLLVAEKMIYMIEMEKYPFVMCNLAPPDMVGHTGVYEAAVKAVEATDTAIGMIQEACDENDYVMLVTSDHGNAEKMLTEHGGICTAHTTNKVPFCMTGKGKFKSFSHTPALCDVAPTVLHIMGLPQPEQMTGQSLLDAPEIQ